MRNLSITYYSSPTYVDRRRDHLKGNSQDYKQSDKLLKCLSEPFRIKRNVSVFQHRRLMSARKPVLLTAPSLPFREQL